MENEITVALRKSDEVQRQQHQLVSDFLYWLTAEFAPERHEDLLWQEHGSVFRHEPSVFDLVL